MPPPEPPENDLRPRLDERVVEVLSEHPGHVAFNGLRRILRAHPESLTRALRRLEREGVVVREDGGYALGLASEPLAGRDPVRIPEPRVVAEVSLPPGRAPEELFGRVAGRWFGELRWFGVYERDGDPWLVWSVPSGAGHVLLSCRDGVLRVRVDRPRDDARSEALEDAARDLLVHVLTRVAAPPAMDDSPRVAEFRLVRPAWESLAN